MKLTENLGMINLHQTPFQRKKVDERIRHLFDNEDSDLVWDLRVRNSGLPEQYSDFLTKCQEFVKAKVETAVDDRRHDQVDEDGKAITHLAMAMSARACKSRLLKSAQRELLFLRSSGFDCSFGLIVLLLQHIKKLAESKLMLRGNLEKNTLTVTTHQQSSATRRNFALSFEK